MKKTIKTLTILLFSSTSILGQNICSNDSLKVVKAFETLFAAIETEDMETLTNISTDRIYCIICSDFSDISDSPYMFDKKDFLENHLKTIKTSEAYQQATKSNELVLVKESDHRSDITAFWTIYNQGELALGHEGGQFGIYFKRVNGEFKFAGMETIP